MSLLVANLLLVLGIGALYFGADWLVRGSARLAGSLGLSPIVVGLTVVSLGTSAPEMAVCVMAAIRGDPDIAMGNVMGSNLANLGLILGLTAVIRPLKVAARVVGREVPLMVLITASLYLFIWDHGLGRGDGLGLLVILAGYLLFVFHSAEHESPEVLGEYEEFAMASQHVANKVQLGDAVKIVSGSVALVLGGSAIVESAEFIAEALGVPHLLISLSVVAVGTSLPELATSLVAALRSEADIAVGNIIGSNIFNVAAILGVTGIVQPIEVNPGILTAHLPAVLFISLLVVPVTWSAFRIRRWEGGMLLVVYGGLMVWLFRLGLL